MVIVVGLGICFAQTEPPKALDLCTVATNIQTYHRRQVRIKAFLGVGAESTALYDPKCRAGELLILVAFNDGILKSKEKGPKELLRNTKKKRYALVTIEGMLYGPEPVAIDPNFPEWLKDRLAGSVQHYGHLGSFEMKIDVEKVIDARDVSDGVRP